MNSWPAVVAVALGTACLPVHAASFDCRRAASATERLVCSDVTAGAADEAMADAYRSVIRRLAPPAAALLRASQRRFPAYLATACSIDRPNPAGEDWEGQPVATCLAQQMTERTQQLHSAITTIGARRFVVIETHDAWLPRSGWPGDGTAADVARPAVDTATLWQIDPARTPAERRWNAAMAAAVDVALTEARGNSEGPAPARDPENPQDSAGEMAIVSAAPDLIVADISRSWYSFGQPHGNGDTTPIAWSLRLDRALAPDDVFRPGWDKAIGTIIRDRLLAAGEIQPETIYDAASAREVMRFTRGGICVSFDPYAFGGYLSPGSIRLSWQSLKALLKPQLPFDPDAMVDVQDRC